VILNVGEALSADAAMMPHDMPNDIDFKVGLIAIISLSA